MQSTKGTISFTTSILPFTGPVLRLNQYFAQCGMNSQTIFQFMISIVSLWLEVAFFLRQKSNSLQLTLHQFRCKKWATTYQLQASGTIIKQNLKKVMLAGGRPTPTPIRNNACMSEEGPSYLFCNTKTAWHYFLVSKIQLPLRFTLTKLVLQKEVST